MKEKLLRIYRTIISTICAMVFSFAPIFNYFVNVNAVDVGYITKWNVADELKNSIKDLNGGVPYNKTFMFESKYYETRGIKSTSYSANGTSIIYGNTDGQAWKSMLAIESGRFYLRSASSDGKGIAFTAPTSGEFEIIPEKIGNLYSLYSIYAESGDWRFEVLKGNEIIYQTTVSANSGVMPDNIKVSLDKGDVLKFLYYAPGYTNNGYTIHSSFSIGLVEEHKTRVPVNPQYVEKVYNPSEYLTTVDSTTFTKDYSIAPFSAVCGSNKTSVTEWSTARAKDNESYIWFTHTALSDTDYYIRAFRDKNTVQIGSKNNKYLVALVFTAPNDGAYTFYGDGIRQSGTASWKFSLINDNKTNLITLSTSNAGGKLNYTVDLKAGENIYYYFQLTTDENTYTTGGIILDNFKVSSVELVESDGYEDGYICTLPKEEYLENAEINVSDDGDLDLSFIGSIIYDYSVYYYDNGAFRPVEEIDDGKFYLFNTYKDYIDLCFKATDENGDTSEYYLTYVYKTGLTYNFSINGKTVFDKSAVNISGGSFDVSVSGKNVSVSYDGKALELTDNQTKIYENKNGIHVLEFSFGDYKKTVEVNAYNAVESNYNRLIGYISVDNNKVNFFASKDDSNIYSYLIKDFAGEVVYSNLKESNRDKTFVEKYGIYNATIGIKNSEDALNSSSYNEQFEIKRPGGEWKLEVITAGSTDKTVYASVGYPVDIMASSTFADSTINNVNYAFYIKEGNSLNFIKDYSEDCSAEFIPEGSGVYEIYVTARGEGSGSAEIVEVINVVVLDDSYSGTVSVKSYDFNGAGEFARIEVEATITKSQELYYKFYAVYQDDIILIKDYSLDNFVEFVPTRPEYFNVRVEVKNQNNSSNYDVFCLYEYQHVCVETELYSLAEFPCDDDAVGVSICDICGKKITVSNITVDEHDYGDWEIVKAPTIMVEGERKRVCKRHYEHVEFETIETLKPDIIELNQTKTIIAKYILGYDVEVYSYCDVNCDGVIDVGDLVLIELYIKGYNIKI